MRSERANASLRCLGADHHHVPLLCSVPGISWVLAYTIAAEIGDIRRFPTPQDAGTHPPPHRADCC
jgi:transposase